MSSENKFEDEKKVAHEETMEILGQMESDLEKEVYLSIRREMAKPRMVIEEWYSSPSDSHNYSVGTGGAAPSDNVNHPSHYNTGKIEVIEAIEDWVLNYHLGNTVKYIARAGKKDPAKLIEDLEKALWYLKRKIELLKAERDAREPVRPNDMVKK